MKLARHTSAAPGTIARVVFVLLAIAPWAFALPQTPGRAPAPPRSKPANSLTSTPLAILAAWTVALPAPASATPGSDSERAYIPLRSGALVALSLVDGSVVWTVPNAEVLGSPEAGDGLVFVVRDQHIEALDARTGTSRWRVEAAPVAAPLFWQNGNLLAVSDTGDATMYRAASGEALWRQPLGGAVRVRPTAGGPHVYLPLEDGRVLALAVESGATVWEAKLPARPTSMHPLDDRLFVGCTDKFFYCLAAADGKTKWRWRTGASIVGTASVDEESVYFLSLDSVLRALDRGNGHQAWKAGLNYQPTAGPFLTSGLLLVPGMAADLAAFRSVDGKPAGTTKLAGEPAAPPRFVAPQNQGDPGRLVVVTDDGSAQLLVPGLPLLAGKPFAGPPYTLPPVVDRDAPGSAS